MKRILQEHVSGQTISDSELHCYDCGTGKSVRSRILDQKQVLEGHFAKKQIFCRSSIISWCHQKRIYVGLELAKQFEGKTILDYGCGDGTFLALLMKNLSTATVAIGCEVREDTVADCEKRLSNIVGLSFMTTRELDHSDYNHKFDGIICMEVLEHVVHIEPLLDDLQRLLRPDGKLLISVPVETGPVLLFKQLARRIAGWWGVGDYPGTSAYTFKEFIASLIPRSKQHIPRPVLKDTDGSMFHDHKGFNWLRLQSILSERFIIEKTLGSPFRWISPHLGTQVWFQLRKSKSLDQ